MRERRNVDEEGVLVIGHGDGGPKGRGEEGSL
jgi:hypothetical protein